MIGAILFPMCYFNDFEFDFEKEEQNKKSIEWYLTLDINQKINLKDLFELLCGVDFSHIGSILSFKERIRCAYEKLKKEGFDIK